MPIRPTICIIYITDFWMISWTHRWTDSEVRCYQGVSSPVCCDRHEQLIKFMQSKQRRAVETRSAIKWRVQQLAFQKKCKYTNCKFRWHKCIVMCKASCFLTNYKSSAFLLANFFAFSHEFWLFEELINTF